MDLRTEKTRRAIINAFIKLRSKKPTEKITIKELAENAQINKATFYLHYRDIYDLSVSLEREVVRDCLKEGGNAGKTGQAGEDIRILRSEVERLRRGYDELLDLYEASQNELAKRKGSR